MPHSDKQSPIANSQVSEGGAYVNTANAERGGIEASPEKGSTAPQIITKSKTSSVKARALRSIQMRRGQLEYFRGVKKHRLTGFVARRQYGKTTTFSKIALYKMMKTPNHTVVFGSAKLNLSREIVRKEAEVIQAAITYLQAELEDSQLQAVATAQNGQSEQRVDQLSADDFADCFEAQRLEFRYYHSRSTYSRTKVIALSPSAVGETGDLMADEIGRIKNWVEVWEAIEPIISSNRDYRLTLSTTVPPDDTHFSFEMLLPPIGTDFQVNPAGNWYRSEMGVYVLRLDAYDAYADGVPVYDSDTGEPLEPAEHRRRSLNKDAWDRNYGCLFLMGGTAACGTVQLDCAQRKGIGQCGYFLIEEDDDLDRAIHFLREHLGPGTVGLGWDLATTEKAVSNPNGFCVMEQRGVEVYARLILEWKTKDPEVARRYVRKVIAAIRQRQMGGPARRLCIDATNERYFAMDLRKDLAGELPVELVISSETVVQPGEEDPITLKQLMGGNLVSKLDENQLILPPERPVKLDFRLVKKERGQFVNELSPEGKHGDLFDGTKQALRALTSSSGGITSMAGVVVGNQVPRSTPTFKPRWLKKGSLYIPRGAA